MSTSQTETAELTPRWSHYYHVRGLSTDETASLVADVTGLTFGQREFSFVGRYFNYTDSELELQVKLNWLEDDELIHPDLPEGVFVYYSSPVEDQFAAEFATVPELELLRKRQFRGR